MGSAKDVTALMAEAIRQRRVQVGRTQEDVAHESEVSIRHYQKIEAGGIDVRVSTLVAIATALGTTAQSLLDRVGELNGGRGRRR